MKEEKKWGVYLYDYEPWFKALVKALTLNLKYEVKQKDMDGLVKTLIPFAKRLQYYRDDAYKSIDKKENK